MQVSDLHQVTEEIQQAERELARIVDRLRWLKRKRELILEDIKRGGD